MSFKKFLISKVFWKNLGYAALIALGIFFITLLFLMIYTHHGQKKTVPDLYGMTIEEASKTARKAKMQFQLVDSIYTSIVQRGHVLEQNPPAGYKAKKNRKISCIINAFNPEMVEMPALVGLSRRQAESIMETAGLEVGKLSYVPDLAVDIVLKQYYHGLEIEAGDSIQKGSVIDLDLGKGLSNQRTLVPDLVGKYLNEAEKEITGASLILGAVTYDQSIETEEDSLNAFIFKQNPDQDGKKTLPLGSPLYLWVTVDSLRLPVDSSLYIPSRDSLNLRGLQVETADTSGTADER